MIDVVVAGLKALAERGEVPRDLAARDLNEHTTIDELAIDSLGKLALISELEDRVDRSIGEGLLQGIRTLGDLAALLGKLTQVAA
jgi:acyl carrier protein